MTHAHKHGLVINCMDRRLQFSIFVYLLVHRMLGKAYLFSVPGGAAVHCVDNDPAFKQAADLTVGSAEFVVICSHEDCAALKEAHSFRDSIEERRFHVGQLRILRTSIVSRNHSARVVMLYWKKTGWGWWPEEIKP